MQLQLISSSTPTINLSTRLLTPKPSAKAEAKAKQQQRIDDALDDATRWVSAMLEANDTEFARQKNKGRKKKVNYVHAVNQLNKAFEALSDHMKPAEVLSVCLENIFSEMEISDDE
jgi:hypothetical protein